METKDFANRFAGNRTVAMFEATARRLGIQAANFVATNATTGRTFAYLNMPEHSKVLGNFYTEDALRDVTLEVPLDSAGVVYRLNILKASDLRAQKELAESLGSIETPHNLKELKDMEPLQLFPPLRRTVQLISPAIFTALGLPEGTERLERRLVGKKYKTFAIRQVLTTEEVEVKNPMGDFDIIQIEVTK